MASGFVAPWQSVIWLASLCTVILLIFTVQDGANNQLNKYELSNFVFKFSISVPDITSIWDMTLKKNYSIWECWGFTGIGSVNLLNRQPWTIYLFYPSLNFMIFLWSSHQNKLQDLSVTSNLLHRSTFFVWIFSWITPLVSRHTLRMLWLFRHLWKDERQTQISNLHS